MIIRAVQMRCEVFRSQLQNISILNHPNSIMSILRNPTSVWRQVLRRCGPCELSRFCSWLTSCRCLLIGSSSRSGPSVYKVAAPGFYPSSSRVGRGPGRGSAADNPHLWYNITLMWRDEHACLNTLDLSTKYYLFLYLFSLKCFIVERKY